MPMTPGKDEDQSAFMKRCVPEMMGDGKREQEQAVAACMEMWRSEKGGSKPEKSADEVKRIVKLWTHLLKTKQSPPEPDEDEDYETFMDRCCESLEEEGMEDDEAEEACQMQWEDYSERAGPALVQKTHTGELHGRDFVLSDESIDRMGDIILSNGWQLDSFKSNPICLFNHSPMHPIGRWDDLRVEGGTLRGKLRLAPEGTSPRIDEIRKLVDAGILRAVSVGFRALEQKPRPEKGLNVGLIYTKSELVETSLVSVPANPNALAVAKSLRISPATCDLVFSAGKPKRDESVRRSHNGGQAKTSRHDGGSAMSQLAQRITDLQTELVEGRDALQAHLAKMNDSNVSDADLETTNTLNAKITQNEKTLEALMASEKLLAKTTNGDASNGKSRALVTTAYTQPTTTDPLGAPIIVPNARKKEISPLDLVVRAGVTTYVSKVWRRPLDETRQKIYGEDEGTKIICEMVTKAASAPALTTVTGWAAELVQQVYTDMMDLLMPQALFTRLSAKGLSLNFGRAGRIIIPTRSRTPTLAGSFVGEGMPIPVRQGAFTSQTLTPKKMAVITTWTREIDEHSIPAIEGVLRDAIRVDTAVAIDSVLIDANAATAIRPPGLLNGVSAQTPTAGGGVAAIVGDLKLLVGALTTNTYGNIRSPVWLMNPGEMLSASLAYAANTGVFPFKEELGRGTLFNIPIIDSSTIPSKTVILIDAADFVSVGGDGPRFELSDQATLHMEDTSPAELVGTGSPGTVASPQRSLFQTDSIALRLVLPLNWVQRRSGTIAWVNNVTW